MGMKESLRRVQLAKQRLTLPAGILKLSAWYLLLADETLVPIKSFWS
jgi:hypothetical protein